MPSPTWAEIVARPFGEGLSGVFGFVPAFLGALIIFVLGLLVATALEFVVRKVFEAIHLDDFLAKLGLEEYCTRAGLKLRGAFFLGRVVFWFFVVVFTLAASDALGLRSFSDFLRTEVLTFVPKVIGAALIILATVVIANFVRRLVSASVESAKLHASQLLGTLAWWAIVIFGLLTALEQLISILILQTIVTGAIAALALAAGLAFGLGGRDYAAKIVKKLE